MADKIIITIEKVGSKISCSAQRSSRMDRATYRELIESLKKSDHLDRLLKLANTVPVKEKDTYENNNLH